MAAAVLRDDLLDSQHVESELELEKVAPISEALSLSLSLSLSFSPGAASGASVSRPLISNPIQNQIGTANLRTLACITMTMMFRANPLMLSAHFGRAPHTDKSR